MKITKLLYSCSCSKTECEHSINFSCLWNISNEYTPNFEVPPVPSVRVSLHQELHGNDFRNRVIFCELTLHQLYRRHKSTATFFFWSYFLMNLFLLIMEKLIGIIYIIGQIKIPRRLREVEHQRPWSVNVWCGIIGDKIIGSLFINGTLNGVEWNGNMETFWT